MRKLLMVIPNYWGAGTTYEEALVQVRKAGGKVRKNTLPRPRAVYTFDTDKTPECGINDMGDLFWTGERPLKVELVPREG